jgi:hypothetical protein
VRAVARRLGGAILAAGLLGAGGAGGADDPVSARAFEVRYRPLGDAAEVVEAVLSAEGTLTLRYPLRTLIVEDRVSVLDRVAALLASYDLPPRSVEITFSLFLGQRREEAGREGRASDGLSREVRGLLEVLPDFLAWTTYEPLGSRSVSGAEGDTVVADLSDEYRVVFTVGAVHEQQKSVKLDRVQLEHRRRGPDGLEILEKIYTAAAVLPEGQLRVVGAAKDPDSQRALFLMLQTRLR